jgi:uncharacterized protein YjiS (DUF1127 family)
MSVHTADSQFTFQLPTLSYIDAKWEEPNLRVADVSRSSVRQGGLAAWLSHKVAAFIAWNRESEAVRELSSMSDRELMDIGLNRTDIGRAFSSDLNADLRQRGV